MFEDFKISSFKKLKPPSNSSFDTSQELKELNKIPLKKDFVKKFDNIESAFAKTAKDNNIKDYDKSIAAKLIKESAPVILKLKKYHNRPRPKDLDKKLPKIKSSLKKPDIRSRLYFPCPSRFSSKKNCQKPSKITIKNVKDKNI